MKIRQFPLAQALYLKYCKEHNRDRLRTIYVQEDDHSAQATCFIQDSYEPKVICHFNLFDQAPNVFQNRF